MAMYVSCKDKSAKTVSCRGTCLHAETETSSKHITGCLCQDKPAQALKNVTICACRMKLHKR